MSISAEKEIADTSRWAALQFKVHGEKVNRAIKIFRSHNIEPILIKGWSAARLYPKDTFRSIGDIDLAVSPDDYETAKTIAASDEIKSLNVDLHEGLRRLDTLPWRELFDAADLVDLDGEKIRVLCEEDQLRVLSVHWLIDGGRFKDKLWDIYYAVANRQPDFDWNRCIGLVAPHRRRWVLCAIGLAHHYLKLKIDDLPFRDEAKVIPQWILRTVEKEWDRSGTLEPVMSAIHDKSDLFAQISRRIPPNAIRSIVELEGDLYTSRRQWFQLKVVIKRLGPLAANLTRYFSWRFRTHK